MTLEEGAAEVKYYRDANEKLGMLIPSSSDYVQMLPNLKMRDQGRQNAYIGSTI